ncbi:hypothetical protein Tco_0542118 [Tanacetum coccineum]
MQALVIGQKRYADLNVRRLDSLRFVGPFRVVHADEPLSRSVGCGLHFDDKLHVCRGTDRDPDVKLTVDSEAVSISQGSMENSREV